MPQREDEVLGPRPRGVTLRDLLLDKGLLPAEVDRIEETGTHKPTCDGGGCDPACEVVYRAVFPVVQE